jgi:hypothetical protein
MAKALKSAVTLDTSAIALNESIDPSDVTVPFDDALDHLRAGRVTISDSDTHVKPLDDAITAGDGIVKTVVNGSGDATIQIATDAKLVALLPFMTAGGQVLAAGINSASATSGYVLTANGAGVASWAAAGGGGAQPVDVMGAAGEALAERDRVYLADDGAWYKADADATPVKSGRIRGICNEAGGIAGAGSGSIRLLGEVSGYTSLTPWATVYAGSTAGAITQTEPAPTAGGAQVALDVVGVATSATNLLVLPGEPVRYMKRVEDLADDGTLTVQHHSDPRGWRRTPLTYIAQEGSAEVAAQYSDANLDSSVNLQQVAPDATGGGTASANSTLSTTYSADKAFDNDNGTYWSTALGTNTGWVRYDFGASAGIVVGQYTIRHITGSFPAFAMKDWTFEGSANGTDWTVLDTQTGAAAWAASEKRAFTIANTTAYRYYRVNVSAIQGPTSGSTSVTAAEIELLPATNTKLGQSFQIANTATIATVDLWLKKTGAPTGDLTVAIYANTAGKPSGAVLATSNAVAASTLGTSYGAVSFSFNTPPSLTGGTTYWMVLETTDSGSATDYVQWASDASTPGYSDGEMKTLIDSDWVANGRDAIFTAYAAAMVNQSMVGLGWWGSTTADLVSRAGDASGGNTATQTTVKNVSGGTFDDINVIVTVA